MLYVSNPNGVNLHTRLYKVKKPQASVSNPNGVNLHTILEQILDEYLKWFQTPTG